LKISGFSFIRNGIKLYYPVVEAVKSVLPIVDEFVIAIGNSDDDDNTREEIEKIGDPKIKIIDTVWKDEDRKGGRIYALETDTAKNICKGDWLFYIQSDECIHEKYLPVVEKRCKELLNNKNVEALVFRYKHFWGDFNHYHSGHGWYPREIRIVRNLPEIHSWMDAQSFRYFENYENPHQQEGTRKLNAALVDAEIYHYGWVRPPGLMQNKRKIMDSNYWNSKKVEEMHRNSPDEFDYGPMNLLTEFKDTHPDVMREFIKKFDWGDKLQLSGKPNEFREKHNHEKLLYKFLSVIERNLLSGNHIGEFKNYELINV